MSGNIRQSCCASGQAKILDMRESTSGAPAAVSLECLGHGQIRALAHAVVCVCVSKSRAKLD